jgi:hypothetical protein
MIGLVRRTRAQPLDRSLLVAEGFKKGIRKIRSIKRLFCKLRYRFFNFNRVQRANLPWVLQSVQHHRQTLLHLKDTDHRATLSKPKCRCLRRL